MGAFYVNCCVRGMDQGEVLDLLRQNSRTGYVGPTVDGWTALVAEDLEAQDDEVIEKYGRDLTLGSDRVAISFLCHDEDVLKVSLFRGGQQVGEFDSAPAYFRDPGEFNPDTMTFSNPPPTEEESRPVLRGAEAIADALGLGGATVMGLLPLDRHAAARRQVNAIELGKARLMERMAEADPEEAHRLAKLVERQEALVAQLLEHGSSEGPLELHERWSEMLGLPAYAVGMGFDYVEKGESAVEWARV